MYRSKVPWWQEKITDPLGNNRGCQIGCVVFFLAVIFIVGVFAFANAEQLNRLGSAMSEGNPSVPQVLTEIAPMGAPHGN